MSIMWTYEPEVDLSGAGEYVVGGAVEEYGGESVFGPVANLVEDGLYAGVGPDVPDLDDLVGAETDQVVPVLVEREVLHGRVVAVEVGEGAQGERVPHDDVALLAARSDETVLARVHEGVHALLMQVEGLVLLVDEVLDVVDVDEAVERGRHDVVKVGEELDLGYPTVVDLLLYDLDSILLLLK